MKNYLSKLSSFIYQNALFSRIFESGKVQKLLKSPKFRTSFKISANILAFLVTLYFIFFLVTPFIQNIALGLSSAGNPPEIKENGENVKKLYQNAVNKQINLQNQFLSLQPKTAYLVVNSTKNEFYLYKKRKIARKGRCSTGSYIMLELDTLQKWQFKTPKGEHKILGKTEAPVWVKPDWAFIEEGLPVPPQNHSSRIERGSLGEYALSLGDGYKIHGTLYKRFLGLPVTHGCVRLNDEDLEAVFFSLNIGSKVYIY